MGQRQQLVEAVIGQPQNLQHLFLGQTPPALEHPLAGEFQDVGHVALLVVGGLLFAQAAHRRLLLFAQAAHRRLLLFAHALERCSG
jgi:hypothetical protein